MKELKEEGNLFNKRNFRVGELISTCGKLKRKAVKWDDWEDIKKKKEKRMKGTKKKKRRNNGHAIAGMRKKENGANIREIGGTSRTIRDCNMT